MPLDMQKRKRAKKRRGGRQISNDYQNESFLLFTGAAIALQNEKGFCSYAEIFGGDLDEKPDGTAKSPAVKQGQAGFIYHKVPDAIFKKLAQSKFPPQLLAVAVCDLIPLDYIHRGGPGSSNAEHLKAKAARIVSDRLDSGMTKTQKDNFNRRLEKERDKLQDHAAGRVENKERSYSGDDYDKTGSVTIDFATRYDLEHGLFENEAEKAAWLAYQNKEDDEVRAIINGTPVPQIDFRGGLKISRRMACYWRKARADDYYACVKFLRELLTARPPSAPSYKTATVLARVPTAILKAKMNNTEWLIRNLARLAEKYKDLPKVERLQK